MSYLVGSGGYLQVRSHIGGSGGYLQVRSHIGGSYINMGSVAIWEVPDRTWTSIHNQWTSQA
jgi:hypothetical protein